MSGWLVRLLWPLVALLRCVAAILNLYYLDIASEYFKEYINVLFNYIKRALNIVFGELLQGHNLTELLIDLGGSLKQFGISFNLLR